jgi:hypothetical protein
MTYGGSVVELVSCPECENVASIEWQTCISGVTHLKVRCIERHWFLLPANHVTYFATDVVFGGEPPTS